MSRIIEEYKGTMPMDKAVRLYRYEYDDGSCNHWLLRDRNGRPYNPQTEAEAQSIIKAWKLQAVE